MFIKNNRLEGTYTDNNGVMVVATAQYLGVIFKIVPTSGDTRTPYYCIPDDVVNPETDGRPILLVGLHQDETDRRCDGKAGHYQSLQPKSVAPIVSNTTVETSMPVLNASNSVTANTNPEDIPMSAKLANEETILPTFWKDTAMVITSLERLMKITETCSIQPRDLLSNSLCNTLYTHIRPNYPMSTVAGRKA